MGLIVNLCLSFLVCYFVFPEAGVDYSGFWFGGFTGLAHGGGWWINWIYSFFDGAHLVKAVTYSGWYNFCWWGSAILGTVSYLILFVGAVISARK